MTGLGVAPRSAPPVWVRLDNLRDAATADVATGFLRYGTAGPEPRWYGPGAWGRSWKPSPNRPDRGIAET